jgi:hypothetical protein
MTTTTMTADMSVEALARRLRIEEAVRLARVPLSDLIDTGEQYEAVRQLEMWVAMVEASWLPMTSVTN